MHHAKHYAILRIVLTDAWSKCTDVKCRDLLKSTLEALDVEEELGDLASAENAWAGIEQEREEYVQRLQLEVQGERRGMLRP